MRERRAHGRGRRRDRVGCYGYARDTTPEIDWFAQRAVRFTHAYSPQAWTLTAHMWMLTALYPAAHGVLEDRPLPEGMPLLAELARAHGYSTLAVVDCAVAAPALRVRAVL